MEKAIYVMASGAKQILQAQTVNTHNLANANTVGFQADLANFSTRDLRGAGYNSRSYAVAEIAGSRFEKGSIQRTGRTLDVAVNGNGWLAVQAADGSEAYTRAGNMKVNINGQLTTGAGHPVLGDGGPIVIPEAQTLEIGVDGTISIVPIGQNPNTMAEVGRIKMVSPDHERMTKGTDGLMRMADGSTAEEGVDVTLISGALESSNVNGIEAMVNMISLARSFEVAVQLMQTSKEMDESSSRIVNLG